MPKYKFHADNYRGQIPKGWEPMMHQAVLDIHEQHSTPDSSGPEVLMFKGERRRDSETCLPG